MPTPPLASPSSAKPLAGGVNPSAAANPTVQPGLPVRTIAEERRRGQRVLLRIRANAHITTKAKETEVVAVTTLSVNPAGAMLISPRNLAAQTRFVLEHSGTKEKIECRVVSMPKHSPEGFQVPVSFDVPSPRFWRIDFPPEDWKPHDDM